MGTLSYIACRLLLSIGFISGISTVIFLLINAVDCPIEILIAERPDINAVEAIDRDDRPIWPVILDRFPNTRAGRCESFTVIG